MKNSTKVGGPVLGLLLLAACGGGGGTTSPGKIVWNLSNNGSTVLDGNGATYYFSAGSGCMFSTVNNIGPLGFCLTSTSGATGPTSCTSPGSNSQCDAASFRVWLTYPLSGPGCIAVLGAPVSQNYAGPNGVVFATYSQTQPLNVTYTGSGFQVQTYKTYGAASSNAGAPTAYAAYWNGQVPGCGGENPFEGVYSIQTGATCSNFDPVTGSNWVYSTQFAIDSAGLIADNGTYRYWGTKNAVGASGAFTGKPSFTSGSERFTIYTINSASQNGSGKWVLQGTYDPALVPVNCGTFTGTFTATQQ